MISEVQEQPIRAKLMAKFFTSYMVPFSFSYLSVMVAVISMKVFNRP